MQPRKQTSIIATLGPASNTIESVRALIRAGANCFRINFSHGDGISLQPLIDLVREAEKLENTHIPILADIQGPKLRIGKLPKEGVLLIEGEEFTISTRKVDGTNKIVYTPYEHLANDVIAGTRILLADGSMELQVLAVEGNDVRCKVLVGGHLYSNKGINLPDTSLSIQTLTEKDRKDLLFVAGADIDMVAISFVRSAHDIVRAQTLLGRSDVTIMSKLERPEALEKLDEILEISDGVMVARGDLGVELVFEKVPLLQKEILRKAALRGKWAVVATQMLGSMVLSSRPTRAEVSDVANAVLDGADAVMLSEETAAGNHPLKAVEAMSRIVREAETMVDGPHLDFAADIISFSAGASGAAVYAADRIKAKAIVVLAGSGTTALLVSKWHPRIPVLALSANKQSLRRLQVLRGVTPVLITEKAHMERQIEIADRHLVQNDLANPGDAIIIVAAIPLGEKKETNTIRFHKVRPVG